MKDIQILSLQKRRLGGREHESYLQVFEGLACGGGNLSARPQRVETEQLGELIIRHI